MTPRTHRNLDAWKEGVLLAQKVYKVTEALPDQERYGLTAQMRRAAVSVPSNIAEGAARASRKSSLSSFTTRSARWPSWTLNSCSQRSLGGWETAASRPTWSG